MASKALNLPYNPVFLGVARTAVGAVFLFMTFESPLTYDRQGFSKNGPFVLSINPQNVLNADTPVFYYYDQRTKTIKDWPQLAVLPVMQYTLRF